MQCAVGECRGDAEEWRWLEGGPEYAGVVAERREVNGKEADPLNRPWRATPRE
jgi:hypothetical protein